MIDLRDDIPRELKVRVRGSVHDLIVLYIQFYQESDEQKTKPSEDKVVDAALQWFFDNEPGFKEYRKKHPTVNGSSARPASTAGVRSAPSSAAPAS